MTSSNIPVYVSKFFRMSASARTQLSPINATDGRVCQLDTQNTRRVLVYVAGITEGWDEMHWSQKALFEEAEKDHTLRISRKKITGTTVEILQQDLFNEPELSLYADKPNMKASLASKQLGFFQAAKHEFVYILSKKDMKQYNPSPQDISDLVGLD